MCSLRILIGYLLLIFATSVQARNVSMVTVDWQPFYGSGLKNGGVVTEVVKTAFSRVGHNATVEFIPFTRAQKEVAEGRRDIVLGAYLTKERGEKFIASDPFYKLHVGFVARRDIDIKKYQSLQDLKGYRIGISRGWANEKEFDSADYLNKDIAKNPAINLQKLLRDRIDMMVVSYNIFRFEANKIKNDLKQFTFLDPPLAENSLHLLGSRKTQDGDKIISDFNKGLRQIIDDGTYEKILEKHGL